MSVDINEWVNQARSLPSVDEEWIMERRSIRIHVDELGDDQVPDILVCFSSSGNIIGTTIVMSDATDEEVLYWAVGCMISPMNRNPFRPRKVVLHGGKLSHLRGKLEDLGVDVTLCESTHPMVDGFVCAFENDANAPGIQPYMSDEDFRDSDIVEAFFQAAAEFYKIKPWKLFNTELPIKIELDIDDELFTYWVVVTGMGGDSYGLGLYESYGDLADLLDVDDVRDAFDVIQGIWSLCLTYVPVKDIGELSQNELDVMGWPIANKSAYPLVVVMDPEEQDSRLPDYEEMSRLLCVTVALTRYFKENKKLVKSHIKEFESILTSSATLDWPDHEVGVSIELPAQEFVEDLIDRFEDMNLDHDEDEDDEMDMPVSALGGSSDPSSYLGRAYQYIYQAIQSDSKSQRVKLAKDALVLSRDCVDGYLILAYHAARDNAEKLKYFKQAADAGKRIISREDMQAFKGRYWFTMDTRPYLRALDDLAEFQMELENYDDAIENYEELIRLNPKDHQDVRYELANCYMMTRRYDDLTQLLTTYKNDSSASMTYADALMTFALHGDSKQANDKLKQAKKSNKFVPDYLSGRTPVPQRAPFDFEVGNNDEAIFYAHLTVKTWQQTDGAIEWLLRMM